MSLIEEAAKRLRQLEEAGVGHGSRVEPSLARAEPWEANKRPEAGPAQLRSLDLARLQSAGFITPAVQDSKLVHEFRVIKRPLIQQALGREPTATLNRNLVMVTSALPGEGKTFVAINLAMSLAMEVDCRVLLIDADVVSPSFSKALGIEPAKGLMDLLTEPDTRFSDAVLGTNVERLKLMLAGTPHAGAS